MLLSPEMIVGRHAEPAAGQDFFCTTGHTLCICLVLEQLKHSYTAQRHL